MVFLSCLLTGACFDSASVFNRSLLTLFENGVQYTLLGKDTIKVIASSAT